MSYPGQFFDPKMLDIRTATTIDGDDWYLVSPSGSGITAMRSDGTRVDLKGAELGKVRKWVLERSERAAESAPHGRRGTR